jgi:hypothetical protein
MTHDKSPRGEACGCPHEEAARRAARETEEGWAAGRARNPLPVYLGWVVLDEAGEKVAKAATMEMAAQVALFYMLSHGLTSVEMRERYFDVDGHPRKGEPARVRLRLETVTGKAAHRSEDARGRGFREMSPEEAGETVGQLTRAIEGRSPRKGDRRKGSYKVKPVGPAGIEVGVFVADEPPA